MSAEAYASSDPCDGSLPHSLSTMLDLPPDAIAITAALARCAKSLTEAPAAFAGLVSTGSVAAGGASAATLGGAGVGKICLDFGVSTGAASEASFGASASF